MALLLNKRGQGSYVLKTDCNVKVSSWYSASGTNSQSVNKNMNKISPFHYPIPKQLQSTHRPSRYVRSTYLKWKSLF